jgi:hypothetical protein
VLVAATCIERDLLRQLALDTSVDARRVARAIDLVARLKAREHLRAGQLRRAIGVRRRAERVRRFVAGMDLIVLDAELGAEHEREGLDRLRIELVE